MHGMSGADDREVRPGFQKRLRQTVKDTKLEDDEKSCYICTMCGNKEDLDLKNTRDNEQIWKYCGSSYCDRDRFFKRVSESEGPFKN